MEIKAAPRDRAWTIGFGPVLFKAGETRRIDTQPKCHFRVERIITPPDFTDIHLLGLCVGREEILKLGGDAISLNEQKSIRVEPYWCEPALPIEVEIVNRSKQDQMIYFSIFGVARL